jgi:uncharacterized membrane protein HdeD (DUF308 family)
MLQDLARNWWLVALRGVAGILFGIMAFIWPGTTLTALVLLLGAYLFIDGIATIAHSISARKVNDVWWLMLLEGIATLIFGALTLFWPGLTGILLISMIAVWSIITGVLEIVSAVRMRKVIDNEWMLIISGIFSVLFGLALIIFPLAGAISIAFIIGTYAIIFGIFTLMFAFRLRKHKDDTSISTPLSGAI